jgi:hypothetical protein
LKGIFSVVRIAQNAPADSQDGWAVQAHQRGKRGFVTVGGEPFQPGAVDRIRRVRRNADVTQVTQHSTRRVAQNGLGPRG